jgi:hypothetical protein
MLDHMVDALCRIHQSKDGFPQFRAGNPHAADAKERWTELCTKWDAKLDSMENNNKIAAFWQHIYNTGKDIINSELATYIEDGCNFIIPKIHVMQHFQE